MAKMKKKCGQMALRRSGLSGGFNGSTQHFNLFAKMECEQWPIRAVHFSRMRIRAGSLGRQWALNSLAWAILTYTAISAGLAAVGKFCALYSQCPAPCNPCLIGRMAARSTDGSNWTELPSVLAQKFAGIYPLLTLDNC